MQAMPTITVDPTVSGTAAGSRPTEITASDGQFSQHLAAAGKSKGTDQQVTAKNESTIGQPDQAVNTAEEFSRLVAGEMQLIIPPVRNQQPGQSEFTGKDSNTNNPLGREQAVQILSLNNSIQIQSTPIQQQKSANVGTTLDSLLAPTTTSGTEQQTPVVTIGTAALRPSLEQTGAGPNNKQAELTIEHWRAQFSYQSSTNVQSVNNPKLEAAQRLNTGEAIVRQPILAYVSPEVEKISAPVHGRRGAGVELPSQRQDANSNFIHSNLPGVSIKAEAEGNKSGQQQNDSGRKNMTLGTMPQPEQVSAAKSGQDTPLIFSLDQERAPGLMPQNQATTTSMMLRLPSGTEIPQSRVINQVIDRFTLNRTLESGTVIMKLHPAELGELRMEIKVEQDNIKAHITTQNPQVQEILDRHLPKLREALEQQGLNLEQMKVAVSTDDGTNGQLFQEHFGQQQSKRSQRSNPNQVAFSLDQEAPEDKYNVDEQQNLSVLI